MEISTRQLKRVTVVAPSGRVDHNTAPQLEEALNGLLEAGQFNIVVDLSGVEYISSAGLRALVAARKAARRWNRGDLKLTGVGDQIRRTFDLVGFTEVFEIYEDLVDAVGSF
ncbi:MAG: STAS domain-containing protein [Anaerolineae bacterium]